MPDAPYQSLYRRYRPQRFAEVRGQDHVTTALRNAVRSDRVGHAYLFSGPRGTGKTSTARILAKALNCTNLQDGEPCGVCDSCLSVQAGSSLDVVELDAASNNGVDAMRDLVARAALGSPGRKKVYIVDEVHMLTTAASNALLKTLEEPPAHVVFVLATTDPQKVLPTIRSRTQPFEFHLLGPDMLSSLLADVNDRAGLHLDPTTLDRVAKRGNGSARDALSALDQAVAAGGAEDELDVVPSIVGALAARDVQAALIAVAEAVQRGRDPRRLGEEIVEHLRAAFLVMMAPDVSGVPEDARPALAEQARGLGAAALVRAMEVLGTALVDMREAPDPRVTLEVALIRLCAPALDTSPAAIIERLEVIERSLASGGGRPAPGTGRADSEAPARRASPPGRDVGAPAPPPGRDVAAPPPPARDAAEPAREPTAAGREPEVPPSPPGPVAPGPVASSSVGSSPRLTIGALRQGAQARAVAVPGPPDRPAPPAPDRPPAAPSASASGSASASRQSGPAPPGGGVAADEPGPVIDLRQASVATGLAALDRDELTRVWGDRIFPAMPSAVRSIYRTGRWLAVEGDTAVFAFDQAQFLRRGEDKRAEVESALTTHLGSPIALRLVLDRPAAAPSAPAAPTGRRTGSVEPPPYEGPLPDRSPEDDISVEEFAELELAPDAPTSAEALLLQTFPGTEEITR